MRLWPRKGLVIVGLSVLALVATACGGNGGPSAGETSPPATPTTTGELTLVMGAPGEFDFSPKVLSFAAGQQVMLTIRNVGKKEHEWMVGREHMDEPGYQTDLLARMEPTATAGKDYKLEGVGEEGKDEMGKEHHGAEVEVEAGGFVTLQLKVPADAAGEWEMGCFLPRHYEAGMKGTVRVA